jgi:3-deoxy-7-phosphoheptulonate synthase
MIVVMQPGATAQEIDRVRERLEGAGLGVFASHGDTHVVLGAVGRPERLEPAALAAMPAVCEVHRISRPYKLVDRLANPEGTVVAVGNTRIGAEELAVIAGPCAVESRDLILRTAAHVRRQGAQILRGGAYKPRSSPYSFQGLGEEGLRYLREAADESDMACVTEVIDASDVELVADYADMLQVGARNMQNFRLLGALGKIERPVLLKRGLAATFDEMLLAAEYIVAAGNPRVVLCERGVRTFATSTRNTLDLSAIPVLRRLTHLPIVVDPSHATGVRDLVAPMARAAVAAGADGVMVEVHPSPEDALSDGPQSLTPAGFKELMADLRIVAPAVRRRLASGTTLRSRRAEVLYDRVLVIGVGLLGGSLATACRDAAVCNEVAGIDVEAALPGIRAAAVVGPSADWSAGESYVQQADLVVLATPVATILDLLPKLAPLLKPTAVVTDVGSTKAEICARAADCAGLRFIGGHPMAGGERCGAAYANPLLFYDAVWALCPGAGAEPSDLTRLEQTIRRLGALPVLMQPDHHDRVAAAVSHVPRLVAAALTNSVGRLAREDPAVRELASGGFRDLTRIASSPTSIWRDIFATNRPAVEERLVALEAALAEIRASLADPSALADQLREAEDHRRATPRRRGGALGGEVTVQLEDQPGALAAVTTALAHEQINIRSVETLSVRQDEDGVLLLGFATSEESARAAGALRRAGYHTRERGSD